MKRLNRLIPLIIILLIITFTIACTKETPTEIVSEFPVAIIIAGSGPTDRDGNLATYNKPDLPLNEEFRTELIDFIKGI